MALAMPMAAILTFVNTLNGINDGHGNGMNNENGNRMTNGNGNGNGRNYGNDTGINTDFPQEAA